MHQIVVGGLVVNVVRKKIKNLHLRVYPPDGRVKVSAPLRVGDEAVRAAVISRMEWIKRHQKRFQTQESQLPCEYVSRESHYYLGSRYLLNVIPHNGRNRVEIRNENIIDIYVPEDSGFSKREKVMLEWYRKELKSIIPPMIEKWEEIIGVEVNDWGVKKMKTKWGSCNINAHRIWLSLELVKKPPHCIEYVVVHEMVHLLERKHNDRFKGFMDRFLPQWRLYRDELNQKPLAHERWDY